MKRKKRQSISKIITSIHNQQIRQTIFEYLKAIFAILPKSISVALGKSIIFYLMMPWILQQPRADISFSLWRLLVVMCLVNLL